MQHQEVTLHSRHNRPFGIDIRWESNIRDQPIVLFIHGFKGFKDAMHFNVIADQIAAAGFTYVKMNFSHNGTTPESPVDFVDLDAFSENNFSKELDDIDVTLDFITSEKFPAPGNPSNINLIGHSRGGGISLIKTSEDDRIKKLVTWAAVTDFAKAWDQPTLDYWKETGLIYIENKRTKQQMPLKYQMAEDYYRNESRLKIEERAQKISVPTLAIHGSEDETVPVKSLELLKSANKTIQTHIIGSANHTFGGKHPWPEPRLPDHSMELLKHTIAFLRA